MQICSCPGNAALTAIPAENECPVSFGQIQKVIFQRLKDEDGNLNGLSDTEIKTKAAWSPLFAASDGTKAVISPYLYGPADDGGDAITYGSGNDVLGGIPEIVGSNPVTFSAQMRHIDQTIATAMKDLICEARGGNLGVYLVSENGQIEAKKGSDSKLHPIPIRSFFVSDKIHGNYDNYDYNNVQWSYEPNYSDGLTIITPTDFDPRVDF